MKKFFLVFLVFFFPLYLLGAEVNASISLDEQYKDGFSAYKSKNFKKSYDIFSKLYLTKLSDAKLNFYFGRSAYETGHYEIALAAFERVEMLDSGNLRNKLEMARTYFMLKMYEDSRLAFEDVLKNPNIPQNIRTNLELYLSRVKSVQQKSFTYAIINIDWMYDSNVNYGSLESQYNISIGTLPSAPEQADRALQVYADVVNVYDLGQKGGFALKNRAKLFLKDYKKLNAYDVQYIAYEPSLLYKESRYLGEFMIGLDLLTLGKKEYLKTVSFSPKFEYSHTNTLRSLTYIKYQKKYFTQQIDYDLNSDHYELAYGLQDILSPRSYVQMNLVGIREKKVRGKRIDVDYDEYRINLSYANQFNAVYGGDIFAQYRKRDYEDRSALFGSIRSDDGYRVAVGVNARVIKTLRLHLKGTYDRVESNQERFAYQKYTVLIGINKTF